MTGKLLNAHHLPLDISTRKRAAAELSRREAVLAAVSFAAEQFLLSFDWDHSIDRILEQLARSAVVSRVSIFENHHAADGRLLTSRRHSWAMMEPPDDFDPAVLQDLAYEAGGFARWETLLGRGQMIHGSVADFPASEQHMLEKQGICSILVMPIFVDQEWWGFIDFCDNTTARTWLVWEMEVLKTVADLFGAAIQHQHLQVSLRTLNAALEQRVVERTWQLGEANRAKTDFLSRLSHELRTPLNVILGFAQLLTVERRKPVQREHVQHILAAGRHLLDLTNETLDIARIETGRLALTIEPIRVHEVVGEVMTLMQPLAIAQQVTMQQSSDGDDSAFVLADRQRLTQVLFNLISNAIKYNRMGGRVSCVWETTPAGAVRIAVHDTGTGIAADDLPRLFRPFERLGAHRTTVEGTGIGLAVCKQLVEAMSGEISVESTLNRGSTFWVMLPGGLDAALRQRRS